MIEIDNNESFIDLKYLILKLKSFFAFVTSQYKIIIICVIIMALLGFYYNKDKKTTYTAQISYVLDEKEGNATAINPLSSFASQFGGSNSNSSGGSLFSGQNLIALFKSRLVIEGILLSPVNYQNKQISVIDLYIQLNNLRNNWKGNNELFNISFPIGVNKDSLSINQSIILNDVYNKLVSPDNLILERKDKKNPLLLIEVNSTNEFFSKFFAETLLNHTSKIYSNIKVGKIIDQINSLTIQIDSVRLAYNNSIYDIANITDQGFNANPALKSKIKSPQLKQVDFQVNTALLGGLINSLESAKSNLKMTMPLFQIIDKSRYPLQKNEPKLLNSILIYSFLGVFIGIFVLLAYFIYLETMHKSK
jgi:hypothetical protein